MANVTQMTQAKKKEKGKKNKWTHSVLTWDMIWPTGTMYLLLWAVSALPSSSSCHLCPLPDPLHNRNICSVFRLHILLPQCLEEVGTSPAAPPGERGAVFPRTSHLASPHPNLVSGSHRPTVKPITEIKRKCFAEWPWGPFSGTDGEVSFTYSTHHNGWKC